MNLIKPYQATAKLVNFNRRVQRLKIDSYSNKRFRTYDMNRLKHEMPIIIYLCSIAQFNKNDSKYIIVRAKMSYYLAKNYIL